jgi:hypothetical protein
MLSFGSPLRAGGQYPQPSPPWRQLRLFDLPDLGDQVRGDVLRASVGVGELLEVPHPLNISVISEWGGRGREIVAENPDARILSVGRLGDKYFIYLDGGRGAGRDPICVDSDLTSLQLQLANLYLTGTGAVRFRADQGRLLKSTFLPSGGTLDKKVAIGLPEDTNQVQIIESKLDRESGMIWAKVEGSGGKSGPSIVWIEIDPQLSGAGALRVQYRTAKNDCRSLSETQYATRAYWKVVAQVGSNSATLRIGRISSGRLPETFLLPSGATLGARLSIGLLDDTTEARVVGATLDRESGRIWAKIEGNGEKSGPSIVWIEIEPKLSGADAIRVQYSAAGSKFRGLSESQYTARQYWKEVVQLGSSSATLVIEPARERLPETFLLPSGGMLGGRVRIGLAHDTTQIRIVESKLDHESGMIWAKVEGSGKKSGVSLIWIEIDPKLPGVDAIRIQYQSEKRQYRGLSESQYATREYWKMLEQGGESRAPLVIEPISMGKIPPSFLLPRGATLGESVAIGLSKHTTQAKIISGTKLSEHHYLVKIRAEDGKGKGRVVTCRVSPEGVTPIERQQLGSLKGQALDRLLTILLEQESLAPKRIIHDLGLLTGERVVPNAVTEATIFHAKWGQRADDCFECLCKNTRVALLHGRALKFLLATETHRDALRGVVSALRSSTTTSIICDLLQSEFPDKEVNGIPIRVHLAQIQAHSETGNQGWLQSYLITHEEEKGGSALATPGERRMQLGWRAYLDSLTSTEISAALARHQCCHSEYYEDRYHLGFARALSYLVSQGKVTADQASAYYPELRDHPGAWQVLDKFIQSLPPEEVFENEEQAEPGEPADLATPSAPVHLVRQFELAGFLVGASASSAAPASPSIGRIQEGRIDGVRGRIYETADLFGLLTGDGLIDFTAEERTTVRRLVAEQLLSRVVATNGTVMSQEMQMPHVWEEYKDSTARDPGRSLEILEAGLQELHREYRNSSLDIGTSTHPHRMPVGRIVKNLALLRGG